MTATHNCQVTTGADVLYLAFELGETQWKLAFTIGVGQKPRLRSMPARELPRLQEEIAKAKKRFQLPVDAPVRISCPVPSRLARSIIPVTKPLQYILPARSGSLSPRP